MSAKELSLGRDRNGNRVLLVRRGPGRGFSIQTNGNLPRTHRDGVGPWTLPEVRAWVVACGSEKQGEAMG